MRGERRNKFTWFCRTDAKNHEDVVRIILRLSESRSQIYLDYAEREQNHEGKARIID